MWSSTPPQGSRNKFSWDEKQGLFVLSGVLPAGAVFPYDFGFLPNIWAKMATLDLGSHGRASLHWLSRSIAGNGVIEAKQTEKGQTKRNDRLIAVAADSRTHQDLKSVEI